MTIHITYIVSKGILWKRHQKRDHKCNRYPRGEFCNHSSELTVLNAEKKKKINVIQSKDGHWIHWRNYFCIEHYLEFFLKQIFIYKEWACKTHCCTKFLLGCNVPEWFVNFYFKRHSCPIENVLELLIFIFFYLEATTCLYLN